MRTLTISLSNKQASSLQAAVDTGAYASNSEVVRDALRLWERREALRAAELNYLKTAYDAGLASGDGEELDRAIFLADLKAERRARG